MLLSSFSLLSLKHIIPFGSGERLRELEQYIAKAKEQYKALLNSVRCSLNMKEFLMGRNPKIFPLCIGHTIMYVAKKGLALMEKSNLTWD